MPEVKGVTGVVGAPGEPGIPAVVSTQGTPVTDNTDYIEALKEMKENTVSKEAYEQLKSENKKLLQSLINGETIDVATATDAPDVAQLRKELFDADGHLSNLEYATKALQLRDALIAAGERDPFLPHGHHYSQDDDDDAAAERVAQVLKNCIEYADGDSAVFTNELQRVMIDSAPQKAMGRK